MSRCIVVQVFERCTGSYPDSQNRHGLAQLMGSFFNRFHAALVTWQHRDLSASVRGSTWCGRWSYVQWEKNYIAGVTCSSSDNTCGLGCLD